MINLAYLIEAHTDVAQLIRLCDALCLSGDVFVHVDKKTKDPHFWRLLNEYTSQHDNIFILRKRENVAWAGYSQVKAFLLLLSTAINSERMYDRFVLLSGLDYPIWSPQKILEFFEEHKKDEFVCGYNISKCEYQYQLRKIIYYHYFRDVPLPHKSLLRRIIVGGSALILKNLGFHRSPVWKVQGGVDVYFGSTWIAITEECAQFLKNQLENNPRIESYFSTVYAPDELCVPTLVMNSSFANLARPVKELSFQAVTPLHYLNYEDCIWSYDEKDYDTLIASGKMFFRKAVSGKSEKLIEMIKETWERTNENSLL